ncbi:hypothetical protein LUZ60_001986 [Juncus effusus]|nr:hypothetical protein LUZ60_001986 [Juncus effusus]
MIHFSCSSLGTILILCLFGFYSPPLVKAQSDSCGSSLGISNLIPFSTDSLNCITAWTSEKFILRYGKNDNNIWSFVLSAPDNGAYISIGFSSNGFMIGSSAMAGWISSNGGQGTVKQYFLGDMVSESCPPDQGNLPLVANSSVIVSQSSTLYLAFQLNIAQPPWRYLIYAVGPTGSQPSNNYLPEHSDQASASVNYDTGRVSGAKKVRQKNAKSHGILVGLGWAILLPIGIILARYLKRYERHWLHAHISVQVIGFVLGMVGIIIGFCLHQVNVSNMDTHKGIGIAVLIMGVLQVMSTFRRPEKSSLVRRYWNWYHHNIGRTVVVLSIINIFLGLNIANESKEWKVYYGMFLAIWGLSCIFLEAKMWSLD